MRKFKAYRVVLAQSVLTEHIVRAASREAAEDAAYEAYKEPASPSLANQWLSDALETVVIEEAQS